MRSRADTCHCGHDKATHFEKAGRCLAGGCDECERYTHVDDPKPTGKRPERPAHANHCRCFRCREWEEWTEKVPA